MAKVLLCLKQGNVKSIHKYVDCRRQQRHRFQLKVHDYPCMCSPCLHTGLSTWAHLYLKATTFVVIRAIYIMNKKIAILSKKSPISNYSVKGGGCGWVWLDGWVIGLSCLLSWELIWGVCVNQYVNTNLLSRSHLVFTFTFTFNYTT